MPISTPSQITVPFATSGLKNSIPSASNPVTGNAGYDAGFPATNMTPKEAGGIPPFGQDFNGILFDITTAIRYLEAGMQFPYSSSFATAVGGYPLGAIVTRTDGTGFWRNTAANNTTDPEAFGAGWSPEGSGISTVAMSNANVTLTALQAARPIIIITGTLTANLNLIFPAYQRQWLVVNRASGSFTVTCKTASGSGVSIPTTANQAIYGDGTNISSAVVAQVQQQTGIVGLSRNLAMSVTSASASATMTADEIIVEAGAYASTQYALGTLSKIINLASTGAGGMDNGAAPASGFVAIYAIYNPNAAISSTNPALLAQNATSILVGNIYGGSFMPAGYTASALVSVWPTNASSQFAAGYQTERTINTATISILASGTATTYTSFSISAGVPLNAKSFNGMMTAPGSSSTSGFISARITPMAEKRTGGYTGSGAQAPSSSFCNHPIPEAQTAYYYVIASNGLQVQSTGYTI